MVDIYPNSPRLFPNTRDSSSLERAFRLGTKRQGQIDRDQQLAKAKIAYRWRADVSGCLSGENILSSFLELIILRYFDIGVHMTVFPPISTSDGGIYTGLPDYAGAYLKATVANSKASLILRTPTVPNRRSGASVPPKPGTSLTAHPEDRHLVQQVLLSIHRLMHRDGGSDLMKVNHDSEHEVQLTLDLFNTVSKDNKVANRTVENLGHESTLLCQCV